MYKKYKLNNTNGINYNKYFDLGNRLYNENITLLENSVEKCLNYESGSIDGDKLKNEWFKSIKADIFLSHSHKDKELAIGFAGWAHKELGLTTFIDSCVWRYAGDLLRDLNDRYCVIQMKANGNTYQYNSAMNIASHIYLMLNIALNETIDRTECLFFLNTPNSALQLKNSEEVDNTHSPWIFSEIAMSNTLRENKPKRDTKEILKHYNEQFENNEFKIAHKLDFNDFKSIDLSEFSKWEKAYNMTSKYGTVHALDILYGLD